MRNFRKIASDFTGATYLSMAEFFRRRDSSTSRGVAQLRKGGREEEEKDLSSSLSLCMREYTCVASFVRILSHRIWDLMPLQLLLLPLLLGLLRFLLFLRLFFCSRSNRLGRAGKKKTKTRKKRLPRATSFGARDKGPTLLCASIPSDLYANDGRRFP